MNGAPRNECLAGHGHMQWSVQCAVGRGLGDECAWRRRRPRETRRPCSQSALRRKRTRQKPPVAALGPRPITRWAAGSAHFRFGHWGQYVLGLISPSIPIAARRRSPFLLAFIAPSPAGLPSMPTKECWHKIVVAHRIALSQTFECSVDEDSMSCRLCQLTSDACTTWSLSDASTEKFLSMILPLVDMNTSVPQSPIAPSITRTPSRIGLLVSKFVNCYVVIDGFDDKNVYPSAYRLH